MNTPFARNLILPSLIPIFVTNEYSLPWKYLIIHQSTAKQWTSKTAFQGTQPITNDSHSSLPWHDKRGINWEGGVPENMMYSIHFHSFSPLCCYCYFLFLYIQKHKTFYSCNFQVFNAWFEINLLVVKLQPGSYGDHPFLSIHVYSLRLPSVFPKTLLFMNCQCHLIFSF